MTLLFGANDVCKREQAVAQMWNRRAGDKQRVGFQQKQRSKYLLNCYDMRLTASDTMSASHPCQIATIVGCLPGGACTYRNGAKRYVSIARTG